MAHKGWYLYDPRDSWLWIVPPKCGSNSFSEYFPEMVKYEGKETHPFTACVIVVRHPYERIVSALSMLQLPMTVDTIIEKQQDIHLKPYHKWIGEREGVMVLPLATLVDYMPDYPHRNKGDHPDWQDTDIDWDKVFPLYEKDFEICPDWSHTQEAP